MEQDAAQTDTVRRDLRPVRHPHRIQTAAVSLGKDAVLADIFDHHGHLHAQARPAARLDFDAQGQRLRSAPLDGNGARRHMGGGADTHPTHGRHRRTRFCGPLEIQTCHHLAGRRRIRQVAQADTGGAEQPDGERGGLPRQLQAVALHLRNRGLHPERRIAQDAVRCHGAGFRLRDPLEDRQQGHQRQDQPQAGADHHTTQQRRPDRDHHGGQRAARIGMAGNRDDEQGQTGDQELPEARETEQHRTGHAAARRQDEVAEYQPQRPHPAKDAAGVQLQQQRRTVQQDRRGNHQARRPGEDTQSQLDEQDTQVLDAFHPHEKQ